MAWFFTWTIKILPVKLLNKFLLQSWDLYIVSLASVLCIFAKTELPAYGGKSEAVICLIFMEDFHKSLELCF